MPRKTKTNITKQAVKAPQKGYLDRIEEEVNTNQSKLNLILGALIILVIGVLVFNYFNRNKTGDTQSQKTEDSQQEDVSPEKLPGKYTIKDGDTLFSIAEKYYKDGYKYPELVKANNLANPDSIEVGQTIDVPKLEAAATVTPTPTQSEPTPTQADSADTEWGPKITGDKYTVMLGDWLSKIAARSYGDAMQYEKIAKANNISNPDLIEPGTVLTIPR